MLAERAVLLGKLDDDDVAENEDVWEAELIGGGNELEKLVEETALLPLFPTLCVRVERVEDDANEDDVLKGGLIDGKNELEVVDGASLLLSSTLAVYIKR